MRGPQNKPIAFPIIGVVSDIKDLGLDTPVEPETYFPGTGREAVLLVRTTVDPSSLAWAVRQAVLSIDPTQPLGQPRSFEEILSTSYAHRRLSASLLSVFALLALVLAAIGIYGVIAYSVTQRTREIGIRMALGAQRFDVLKMVLSAGLALALIGVAAGFGGAFVLTRWMAALLFGVTPTDAATFVVVPLCLIVVAMLACYLPARRATKVDPLTALRYE